MALSEVAGGIKALLALLFDTSVSQNNWIDSDECIEKFCPMPFFEAISSDSTTRDPTKRAVDRLLDTFCVSFWDSPNDIRFVRRPNSEDLGTHNPTKRAVDEFIDSQVENTKYLSSFEAIKKKIDTGFYDYFRLRIVVKELISGAMDFCARKEYLIRKRTGCFAGKDYSIRKRTRYLAPLNDPEYEKQQDERRTAFNRKLDLLDSAIIELRDSLRVAPFLNLEYENGVVYRIGISHEVDLNGRRLQKRLFEQCYSQKGNPTATDKMVDLIYGKPGKEGTLSTLKGDLNKTIEILKIGIDSKYRLEDIQPEDLSG